MHSIGLQFMSCRNITRYILKQIPRHIDTYVSNFYTSMKILFPQHIEVKKNRMKTGAAPEETPLDPKELAYVDYAGLELFTGNKHDIETI